MKTKEKKNTASKKRTTSLVSNQRGWSLYPSPVLLLHPGP
jgi:hypothetical protein